MKARAETVGVWTPDGEWLPVPYVDERRAELLFRHKLLTLLRDRGLLSQERIDLLMSWRHSGFSVHNRTSVYPADNEGLHKLACYLMSAPVKRLHLAYPTLTDGLEDLVVRERVPAAKVISVAILLHRWVVSC